MSERVSTTITDGVADVRMTRADKRNAIDNDMFLALAEAGEALKTEPGLRAVVLSGEGGSFCAGLDFASFATMTTPDPETAGQRTRTDPAQTDPGRITQRGQQALSLIHI